MNKLKILVTCRQMQESLPMLGEQLALLNWKIECPDLEDRQHFSDVEMASLICDFDAAIVGDDQISEFTLSNAKRLKAVCKWGVGTDGLDLQSMALHGIKVGRTPDMFGEEVADVALAYVICLARRLFEIDRAVRAGLWKKPTGYSLRNMQATVLGYGDIGRAITRRLRAIGLTVRIVDPSPLAITHAVSHGLIVDSLESGVAGTNFLVIACPLNDETKNLVNHTILTTLGSPAFVVNVARGAILCERDLLQGLQSGAISGAALDVLASEPLAYGDPLRNQESVIFGSHNASNTYDASLRASRTALTVLQSLLEGCQ